MNGFLIIDKPGGMTSHDVVRRVRRLTRQRRIGHTGTLDPLATGVLPLALGTATRLVQFLLEGDKSYRATLKLGETTDTQDSDGTILERRPAEGIDPAAVAAAAARLTGEIEQVPPMYSAIKKDGVPLHRLARKGVVVERSGRPVTIKRLEILGIELPQVTLEVDCSKGTYVRTLCHDLGELLGCGAHLTSLRRLSSGPFTEADSVRLEELERLAGHEEPLPLVSPEKAVGNFRQLEINEQGASRLANGIPPELAQVRGVLPEREGQTVVLLRQGRLTAMARYAPSRQLERRGDFELIKVFHSC